MYLKSTQLVPDHEAAHAIYLLHWYLPAPLGIQLAIKFLSYSTISIVCKVVLLGPEAMILKPWHHLLERIPGGDVFLLACICGVVSSGGW